MAYQNVQCLTGAAIGCRIVLDVMAIKDEPARITYHIIDHVCQIKGGFFRLLDRDAFEHQRVDGPTVDRLAAGPQLR